MQFAIAEIPTAKKLSRGCHPGPLDVTLLETDFEEGLALAWGVGLARVAAATAIGVHQTKSPGSVVHIVIDAAAALVDTADLHAIQDVEEFNAELGPNVLAKKELFGQANILVGVEGISENGYHARLIARCESRIGEGCRIKNGQAFVIVVVIQAEGNTGVEVRAIKAIQEWIVVVGVDGLRCTAGVLKHSADLPASKNILGERTAFVQERLSRTDWKFVYGCYIQQMSLVVAGDGPFGFLIEFVLGAEIERGKAGIGVRHCLRQRVGNEEAEAVCITLLRLHLQSVIEGGAGGVELIE